MRFIIIRHAKAEREAASGCDADRAICSRGRQQAEYLGRHLAALTIAPQVILTSELVRSQTTARILSEHGNIPVETEPALHPDATISELIAVLERHAGADSVVLVGHNPQMGELISLLVHGLGGDLAIMRKGELVEIEVTGEGFVGTGVVRSRVRLTGHAIKAKR